MIDWIQTGRGRGQFPVSARTVRGQCWSDPMGGPYVYQIHGGIVPFGVTPMKLKAKVTTATAKGRNESQAERDARIAKLWTGPLLSILVPVGRLLAQALEDRNTVLMQNRAT